MRSSSILLQQSPGFDKVKPGESRLKPCNRELKQSDRPLAMPVCANPCVYLGVGYRAMLTGFGIRVEVWFAKVTGFRPTAGFGEKDTFEGY